jgi:hypothetical protein
MPAMHVGGVGEDDGDGYGNTWRWGRLGFSIFP